MNIEDLKNVESIKKSISLIKKFVDFDKKLH
jgi:hypothetical protein